MSYRSSKPPRCQHKPSSSCALCRREKNDLEQVGAWAREPSTAVAGARSEPTDYASFVQDTALRTTTKVSTNSSTTHSKKSNNHQHRPQQQRIKPHQPSLPVYTSNPKTPSSSVAATRSNSPIAHRPISVSAATSTPRTVPVYHTSTARQPALPVSSKSTATVGSAGQKTQASVLPRVSTASNSAAAAAAAPATARPGAHFVLVRGGVCVGGQETEESSEEESESEKESEEESESESEEDSDDSDEDEDEDEDDD
ncbi:hypothetical protein Q7P36_009157 [Cladosporium allicinum]